ncbi:hypothetical protein RHGRI_001483 [Rhododendron griersonianum]|uniref:FAR1 domain-containing protein n=1 Tax=Rhododendron griersonianum TaxID=479676 RepID=A0AAV6LKS0_9ERIC|nr:hypothetical protein RHGRI_001483 [Rhododendron griersonianum]
MTNGSDTESSIFQDFTEHFTTDTVFPNEEALKEWLFSTGRKHGFVFIIKGSELNTTNRRPRIGFACERSGKSLRKTGSNKCECPFEVRCVKEDKGWTLTVFNGTHNHPSALEEEGHEHERSLSSKKMKMMVQMQKIMEKLKEFTQPNSTSLSQLKRKAEVRGLNPTIEEIPKSSSVSRFECVRSSMENPNPKKINNTKGLVAEKRPTSRYMKWFPVGIRKYIAEIKDVNGDENCGYRAILVGLGNDEEGWLNIRKDIDDGVESLSFALRGDVWLYEDGNKVVG